MKKYDAQCPNCGHLNRDLYLEDSNGWMECESCGCISRPGKSAREHGAAAAARRAPQGRTRAGRIGA